MSLAIATLAVADFVGSALLVAVTCTLAGDGKSAGAVNIPELVIVPLDTLPPETPFTLQVTVVSAVFFTVAMKVIVFPSNTALLCGVIATVICGGGGGGAWTNAAPPEQPDVQTPIAKSAKDEIRAGVNFGWFCWERGHMPQRIAGEGPAKGEGLMERG
jgi:hypothetical protein